MKKYFNNFSKDKLRSKPSAVEAPVSVSSLIATCGLQGRSVFVPGTVGTLMAIPFAFLLSYSPFIIGFIVISILFSVGTISSQAYAKAKGSDDPSEVVIDEFVAYLLVTVLFAPSFSMFVITFILFRLFDAIKPFPISWLDHNIEGGLGIMVDDIAAAVATIVVYTLLLFII